MNTPEIGYVEVTIAVGQAGEQDEALGLELGTATCGDTLEEAIANIKDAVVVHLTELGRTNQLAQMLAKLGIPLRRRASRAKSVSLLGVPRNYLAAKYEVPLAVGAAA